MKIIDKIKKSSLFTFITLFLGMISIGGLMNYILLPLYVKLDIFLPSVLEAPIKETIIFCLLTSHIFWILFMVASFVLVFAGLIFMSMILRYRLKNKF